MADYVSDSENARKILPLVKSYGALSIRNVDPMGNTWQQSVLSRSTVALDTDAALTLLIQELPSNHSLRRSLQMLASQGTKIILPNHVLDEVVDHLSRAHATFTRFKESLLRMPAATVESNVWHALVRGFYYFRLNGESGGFESYWYGYWDSEHGVEFAEAIFKDRLSPLHVMDLHGVSAADDEVLNELEIKAMAGKEQGRIKSQFRDLSSMTARVRSDISMALMMAKVDSDAAVRSPRGYVLTSDSLYWFLQRQDDWGKRRRVAVDTLVVPQLASFVSGRSLDDEHTIELLFHDVTVAAAEAMQADITDLAALGIDLARIPLSRLDWDLRNGLADSVQLLRAANDDGDFDVGCAALGVISAARDKGYALAAPVQDLLDNQEEDKRLIARLKEERDRLESSAQGFLNESITASPAKTRTRLRGLAKKYGLEEDSH